MANALPTPGSGERAVRGAFVVLEGLDRSGKTTQVELLAKRLRAEGRDVEVMRFPDRTTPIGQMIDAYLKSQAAMDDHVIHLLFSANRWEAVAKIAGLLAKGTTVVCDRYYYSGMVYSAAKHNPALTLPWARAPEVGLPRPDLVVFLDLTEDEAKKRGGWGDEIYEKAAMQSNVRQLFWGLSLGRIDPDTGAAVDNDRPSTRQLVFREEEEDLYVTDASTTVDAVADAVWTVASKRIAAVERGELGRTVRRVT
ncbi:dTMP kinase [Sporothrix schenckii 1099-18]|uniref:Thymidylate kinase n=2 Tax=Sporothrix schenckii TaxID=29908 RepID=U7Q3N1_SPOS1|nr:dTMP kinase [Sporothrix schenckii 1099-18]ERT01331.1 thymidylate kinase [Sporothrix schenckii ATCC 58251]KJR88506.1 dTMP kinase [Sporothrix schenckii 1099-18]